MGIDTKATIRNRFDIEVKDIKTGEVKKYQAHNIVLNQMWSRLVNFQSFFVNIHFGTGTGFLEPTRTSLFNHLGTKAATTEDYKYAYPTSYRTGKVVLNPEEYVGAKITEVGVAYGSTSSNLVTHAFIEDAAGNSISLVKTDTNVVTIYATIYFELGGIENVYGGKVKWVEPLGNNDLVRYFMGISFPTQRFYVSSARGYGSKATSDGSTGSSDNITTANWIKDASNRKVTTPVRRLGVNVGNGAIRSLGLGSSESMGIIRCAFPIPGVFSGKEIANEVVGEGDGFQKAFNLKWKEAVQGSIVVKIDNSVASGVTVNELFDYVGVTYSNTPSLSSTGMGCAFSPDGAYLAVAHYGGKCLTVINTSDWSVVSDAPSLPGTGMGCALDGAYLAVAHVGGKCLTVIDTSDWSVVSDAPSLPGTGGCAFSPDGAYLAVAHSGGKYLTVIDTSDWSVVSNTPTLSGSGYGCAFYPDGVYLAVAHSGGKRLTVINTSDWSVVSDAPSLSGTGRGCAFSPDGAYLAVAHYDGKCLTVINTSDWSVVSDAPSLPSTGMGCAFSPDGAYLAVAHNDGKYLTVIDTSDWSVVSDAPTLSGSGYGCAFSPDGACLAVAHSGGKYLTVIDGIYNAGATHNIIFDTPPPIAAVITADYTVPFIPKDENHVLDLQVAIQFGEGL